MEDYFETPQKYNKLLWKYLGLTNPNTGKQNEVHSDFKPNEEYELLRMVLYKIKKNPTPGNINRILISIKEIDTEVIIQGWHDINNVKGYVNIVKLKAKTEHRAVYNACVDYVIKTT